MLGQKKRFKRKLEDDLQRTTPNAKEWNRCMEGFSDFSNNNSASKSKRLRTQKKGCQTFLESSFDNLAGFGSDASGKNEVKDDDVISWSSSDGENDDKEKANKKDALENSKTKRGKTTSKEISRKPRTPKVNKLELHRLSPCFEVSDNESSDGDIDSACSSPVGEEDEIDGDEKPKTHLADLPKQTTPVKISKLHSTQFVVDSQTIGSIQSCGTSNSDSPGTSGIKASDWLKGLDWQTPVKVDSQEEAESMALDSAKKKRIKYKKDGLASRLSRLQSRERTAVRIWEHQKTDEIESSNKALLVRIHSFETLYSLQLTHCHVASIATETPLQGREQDSVSEGGEQDSLSEGGEWKSQIILFSKHMMEKLEIGAGALLKIYPPWQQLQLASIGEPVLLCTNYTQVISPWNENAGDNTSDTQTDVLARWNCPCSRDPSISMDDCPVKRIPYLPSHLCSNWQAPAIDDATSHSVLETVTQSQLPYTTVCESLLEAIQKTSLGKPLSYRAAVQRVFCAAGSKYSLLVEDSHGTMAVVNMGDNSVEDSVIQSEGMICVLSGLKVVTRSNKERNHALFTVLSEAWSGHMIMLSSQESQEDESAQIAPTRIPCPGFCYVLEPENALFTITVSQSISPSFRKQQLSTLAEVKQVVSHKRVSFLARVIYRNLMKTHDQSETCVWYVMDDSISSYMQVKATSECFVTRQSSSVILFTDVLICDKLQADTYTRTRDSIPSYLDDESKRDRCNQLRTLPISLPVLDVNVQTGDLVSLEGVITSIDEESAYSWEECDGCGSDRLMEEKSGASVCVNCQKRVTSPVTRMKMEAYIKCGQLGTDRKLKVDLLQSTVEKLLPDSGGDEGYDIDCVLNQPVGPLNCEVREVCVEEIKLKEFLK